jgi:hypothetical protein
MPVKFFQISLTVTSRSGGAAELIPPKPLRELTFEFVLVRQGGEEAIVRVEASEAELKEVEKAKGVKRLTPSQMKKLRDSYPAPALKRKLTMQPTTIGEGTITDNERGVPKRAEMIEQTVQTVRSGFYMIDVPLALEQQEADN